VFWRLGLTRLLIIRFTLRFTRSLCATMNSEAVSALLSKNPALKGPRPNWRPWSRAPTWCTGAGDSARSRPTTSRPSADDRLQGQEGPHDGPGLLRRRRWRSFRRTTCWCARRPSPRSIQELIAENPAQLVVEALESYPNTPPPRSTSRSRWPRSSARRSSRNGGPTPARPSPRTPASPCRRRRPSAMSCARRPVSAEDEIFEQFNSTRSARRRISWPRSSRRRRPTRTPRPTSPPS
jgi:hypothetical protein